MTGTLGGIAPAFDPNIAAATIRNDLLAGGITIQPFGNITASPSQAFDLFDARLACTTFNTNPQIPGVPLACTVTVTAVDKDNNPIPEATFSFSPTNLLSNPMVNIQLPNTFRHLKSVTFGVATSSLLPATTVLFLDNVRHCNYS